MNDKTKITRTGLTLIELMVASAIIAMMILWVGAALSGLGQLVRVSQSTIRRTPRRRPSATWSARTPAAPARTGSSASRRRRTARPSCSFLTPGLAQRHRRRHGHQRRLLQCRQRRLRLHGGMRQHRAGLHRLAHNVGHQHHRRRARQQSQRVGFRNPSLPTLNNGFSGSYLTNPGQYQYLGRWDCNTVVTTFQNAANTLPATVWPVANPPTAQPSPCRPGSTTPTTR